MLHKTPEYIFALNADCLSCLSVGMEITAVPELAQAINRAGGGKGGRWWLKRKNETACVIGLHDSEAREVILFSRELWGLQPPGMYLQKLGDWSDVDYDVATDVIIYCQEEKKNIWPCLNGIMTIVFYIHVLN